MSRTKRFFNNPNSGLYYWSHDLGWIPYWHPWKVIWSNKECPGKELMSKRRRELNRLEIQRELNNLCPYTRFEDNCNHCLMRWYGDICNFMDEQYV